MRSAFEVEDNHLHKNNSKNFFLYSCVSRHAEEKPLQPQAKVISIALHIEQYINNERKQLVGRVEAGVRETGVSGSRSKGHSSSGVGRGRMGSNPEQGSVRCGCSLKFPICQPKNCCIFLSFSTVICLRHPARSHQEKKSKNKNTQSKCSVASCLVGYMSHAMLSKS